MKKKTGKRSIALLLSASMALAAGYIPGMIVSAEEAQTAEGASDYTLTAANETNNTSYETNDTCVSAENAWDGSADTSWYQEGKTQYTLNTPEQLAGLAQLVNNGNTFEGKKLLLGNDMFFNEDNTYSNEWTSIASKSSGISFEGTFDGQGHSLYNMYTTTDVGLFGNIGGNGVVKAVRISQGKITGAAIAYRNAGWILFCENDSTIYEYINMDYVAGICCWNENLIYGCGNTGEVEGTDAAGIAGVNKSDTNAATVDSCWNQGDVTGDGAYVGGIVSSNYNWVYNCYNSGNVLGVARYNSGIVGENQTSDVRIYNCYNIGSVEKGEWEPTFCDTICTGGGAWCSNVYSISSIYNNFAAEITTEELGSEDAVEMLQGDKGFLRWTLDKDNLNNGCIIPTAQQDMYDGSYKMLPDIWGPVTEVSLSLGDKDYSFKGFSYAYFGMEEAAAVYSTDSDVLSITPEGIITPLKTGTAVVKVTFEETEHTKETSYDVTVTITGMSGDVNSDGSVNITDLMMCLYYVSGRTELDSNALAAADVNDDGAVTIIDLMRILYYVSGRNTEL